jgi:cytochrome c-type biogenesis protein CcmH
MSGFLPWAALLLVATVAIVCLPLLRRRVGEAAPAANAGAAPPPARWLALGLGLAMAAVGAGLYPLLSNYAWKAADERAQLAEHAGIPALLAATREHPADVSAWLKLGAGWAGLQRWTEARAAFAQGVAISGRHEAAALAGLGQVLVLGGDGQVSPQALGLFEEALRVDPTSQQALFYSGLAYLQQERVADARARFVAMLALDPPQNVRDVLQKQVAELDTQLAAQATMAASSISLQLSLAAALAGKVPAGASLFVFVPSPGGGPPLAVKRLGGRLPQQVSLSAADSMLPGHTFKAGDVVKVVARLSTGGSPLGSPGDLFGEIQAKAGEAGVHALVIDRQVPAR